MKQEGWHCCCCCCLLLLLLGGEAPWGAGEGELVGGVVEAAGGLAVLLGRDVVLGVRASVMGPAVVARVASVANCCVPAKLPEGPWLSVSVTWAPVHSRHPVGLHGGETMTGEAACRVARMGGQGEGVRPMQCKVLQLRLLPTCC